MPSTTTIVISAIGQAYSTTTPGSNIKPMATKKIALNMSRIGSIRCSMRLSERDSAITAPIRNAPSATL